MQDMRQRQAPDIPREQTWEEDVMQWVSIHPLTSGGINDYSKLTLAKI